MTGEWWEKLFFHLCFGYGLRGGMLWCALHGVAYGCGTQLFVLDRFSVSWYSKTLFSFSYILNKEKFVRPISTDNTDIARLDAYTPIWARLDTYTWVRTRDLTVVWVSFSGNYHFVKKKDKECIINLLKHATYTICSFIFTPQSMMVVYVMTLDLFNAT
jgi:hypothetical protein